MHNDADDGLFDLMDWMVSFRFDYTVDEQPVVVSWPVTRPVGEYISDELLRWTDGTSGLLSFPANRVRRDIWINPQRVAECMILHEVGPVVRPTILDAGVIENGESDSDTAIPHDLYPLAAIGFSGSDHSYEADRWISLYGCLAAEIRDMIDDLERRQSHQFIGFADDDSEMRIIRRSDLAFIDIARLATDTTGEVRFQAEGGRPGGN